MSEILLEYKPEQINYRPGNLCMCKRFDLISSRKRIFWHEDQSDLEGLLVNANYVTFTMIRTWVRGSSPPTTNNKLRPSLESGDNWKASGGASGGTLTPRRCRSAQYLSVRGFWESAENSHIFFPPDNKGQGSKSCQANNRTNDRTNNCSYPVMWCRRQSVRDRSHRGRCGARRRNGSIVRSDSGRETWSGSGSACWGGVCNSRFRPTSRHHSKWVSRRSTLSKKELQANTHINLGLLKGTVTVFMPSTICVKISAIQ